MYNAPDDWGQIRDELDRFASSDDGFDVQAIQKARQFVDYADGHYPTPTLDKGYWPTVAFSWSFVKPAPIEIEVHPDRFEFYRFFDGRTQIQHFPVQQHEIPTELGRWLDQIFAV